MLRVLRRPRIVENMISSPSRLAQITLDCGLPSALTVDSTQKALPSSNWTARSGSAPMRINLAGGHDQGDGDRREPFAAPGEPQPVRRRAGHPDGRADRVPEHLFR